LEALVQQGHEVIACAPEIDWNIEALLSELGVICYSIPLLRTGLTPLKDLNTIFALKKMFLREKADIVFCYTVKPVIYGSFAAFFAGVPEAYAMITGLGYTSGDNTLKQKVIGKIIMFLYQLVLKKNSKVFFQNPDDRDLFVSHGLVKKKSTCLINGSGVDLVYYNATPLPDKISFLLIARLIKEKGIYEYVEAVRIIKQRHPEVIFTLVGWLDPSPAAIDPEDLKKWQQNGLIKYNGKMEDVRPAIANASVYVLPSYREGTPRTVLEAMAMGRPVITTDVPGCRETVIDGENGYLVSANDPAALAVAMEKFIQQPKLIQRMGMAGRKMAEERFDVHKVNEVILHEMNLC
jgi:glycosyltransferase involved in cell wall biosynthesis